MCGNNVIALLGTILAVTAQAQLFNFRSIDSSPRSQVHGRTWLEPSAPVAGELCAFMLELDVEKGVGVEDIQVSGRPDATDDVIYGDIENLADITSTSNRVTKRFRIPVRFLAAREISVVPSIHGMQTIRRNTGGMSLSSSSSFAIRPKGFRFSVSSLPENGRPLAFSGAIGRNFSIKQRLAPENVHPGDLVTATYELSFEGYCPSNSFPSAERLSREFSAYPMKETARTGTSITWTQMLVPKTAAATNSALVSFNFYNLGTKRYEVAVAHPARLNFISAEAASTENTQVAIDSAPASGEPATLRDDDRAPLTLRFAPSDSSPVIATLPPGTPAKECGRVNGWRRLATSGAIGWSR